MRSLLLTIFLVALLPSAFLTPFIGVLLWSWVSFMSPHRLVWGIGDSLPWAAIVGSVGIAGWLISERRRIPIDATTVLMGLLLVAFSVSTYFSLVPELSGDKWWAIVKEFVFFFITAALVTNRIRAHALMWIMVISVGFYGIKGGVFTLLTGGQYLVWGPDLTAISDNNHLATALVMTLPLMNYLGRQSKNDLLRVGSRVAMAFTLLAILASYSRGAFLALSAMIMWFWRHSQHKFVTAVVIAATLAFSVAFMPSQWITRIQSIETYQQDASAAGRLDIWAAAFKIAKARPLVGGGFLAPYQQKIIDIYAPGVTARAVHSIWLEVLGENGFPAFFLWVGLLVVALNNCRVIIRQTKKIPQLQWANDLAHMSTVALLGYMVGGSFLSLPYWDFYYTLLVLISCVRRIATAEIVAMGKATPDMTRQAPARLLNPAPALPAPAPPPKIAARAGR